MAEIHNQWNELKSILNIEMLGMWTISFHFHACQGFLEGHTALRISCDCRRDHRLREPLGAVEGGFSDPSGEPYQGAAEGRGRPFFLATEAVVTA